MQELQLPEQELKVLEATESMSREPVTSVTASYTSPRMVSSYSSPRMANSSSEPDSNKFQLKLFPLVIIFLMTLWGILWNSNHQYLIKNS